MKKRRVGKRTFSDYFKPLSKRWDFLFVFLFILIRLVLNLGIEPLKIFFAVCYIALSLLMFTSKKSFFVAIIIFLFIDSLIGTFIFIGSNNLGLEYFGTMAFNLIIILFVVFDMNGNFKGKN